MPLRAMTLALLLATAPLGAVEVGAAAPPVRLKDQTGTWRDLSGHYGREWAVLTFYPADMTSGCTLEAVSVSQTLDQLTAAGIAVYGVSVQDVASKQRFCEAHDLRHPLLADEDKSVSAAYGVLNDRGVSNRVTVLIDPAGTVRAVDSKVSVRTHGPDILAAVQALQRADAETALGTLADEPVEVLGLPLRRPQGWPEAQLAADRATWTVEGATPLAFTLERAARDAAVVSAEALAEAAPEGFEPRLSLVTDSPGGAPVARLEGTVGEHSLSQARWRRGDRIYTLTLRAPRSRAGDAALLLAAMVAAVPAESTTMR